MQSVPELGSRAEKKHFYKNAVRMTLPIAFQNLMDACVSSADVIMLMFVGKTELAASSLAGQVMFVLQMLLFGISSGASVLSSQYWGKGDRRTIERVLALSMRLSVLIGLALTLAAAFFPGAIMHIFTNDDLLIGAGKQYLVAVSASYVLSAFATVYLAVMRSVERVKMSAFIHGGAVAMNIILNACFIFGIGFFPALGITGVALATSITRFVEVAVCVVDTLFFSPSVRLRMRDLFSRHKSLFRDFVRYSVPAAANDIIWGLAFSLYSVILGHLNNDIVAANSVAGVVRSLSSVVCFGASSAAAIILGKEMGAGRLKEARVYASRFVGMAVYTAIIGGLVVIAFRQPVLGAMHFLVDVNENVQHYVSLMLWINSYYILGQSVNTMLICGVFRAGGDVKFGLICDCVAMWAYAVPIGFISAFVLKLPEMWVYFILCLDEFVKMPIIIRHYLSRRWLNDITKNVV